MAETGVGDSSSPDGDRDFEPSAELLVHDYDDEQTLEEEENLSSESGDNEELDDLQKESDMPLTDVLAMYGYSNSETNNTSTNNDNQESRGSSSEEEILNNRDLTLDKEEVARDVLKYEDASDHSTIDELIENAHSAHTAHLLNGSFAEDDGAFEDDEDEDYFPILDEELWKKMIQIGEEFQADIPEFSTGPYSNKTEPPSLVDERLLWDPEVIPESEVTKYLNEVNGGKPPYPTEAELPEGFLPDGEQVRDDEQALYTLLQSDFNVEEAMRRKKLQTTPPTDPLSLWSEDECQNFESGLRVYGKNFFAIHQNKVRTRSVGELVQFYYFWKKTERRDAFCNRGRIEKKKPSVTPGITDYTDRFVDKADSDEDDDSVSSLPLNCACNGDNESQGDEPTDDTTPSHKEPGCTQHPTTSTSPQTAVVGPTLPAVVTSHAASNDKLTNDVTHTAYSHQTMVEPSGPTPQAGDEVVDSITVKRPHSVDNTSDTAAADDENDTAVKRLKAEQGSYTPTAATEVGN